MKQMQRWPVAVAKAKFSQLLDQAQSDGPQTVTRYGRPTIVVVSAADWQARAQRTKSLSAFFRDSPLRGSGLKAERFRSKWRQVEL